MVRSEAGDPYELERFVRAQEGIYSKVLRELSAGRKHSHWMWYIFPQVLGLGRSRMSELYAIRNANEARAYLQHAILGGRLVECVRTVLRLEGLSASEIFGYPDDLKFRSSMTLFASVSGEDSQFEDALNKYFAGELDARTQHLLR